ncbi:MAG: hypothetical protein IBX68_10845 [Dehalococcoidia bacterium]|nr:hypothetical protein [Dehalococcoidia bacterium]
MKRILIPVVAVILALLILVPSSVSAYTLLGPKWLSVDPLLYWWNYYDFEEDPIGLQAWWDSVQDWNGTPTPVNYQWTWGGSQVRLGKAIQPNAGWDGLSTIHFEGDTIVRVTCAYNWSYTRFYTPNKIRSVTGHELGHSLGLGEMGLGSYALMNQFTSGPGSRYDGYGIYTPRQDDINGVNAMY